MALFLKNKLIYLLILTGILIWGCSDKKSESAKNNDQKIEKSSDWKSSSFENWERYTYQDVIMIYPGDHMFKDEIEHMLTGFVKYRKQVCDFLGVPVSADTVKIYFCTGYGQLEEYTGVKFPTVKGNDIYYALPYMLGSPMTEYVLNRWHPNQPKYLFLKHGIMTLFDFSGQDYHGMTLNYVDSKTLISLNDLAVDTTVNTYLEKHQSGEAASFIAFILDNYKLRGLEKLYLSQEPFEQAVQHIFKTDVNVLQNRWLEYTEKMYYRQLNN